MKKYTLPIVAISTGLIAAGGVSTWDWHKRPMSLPGASHLFHPASAASLTNVMAALNEQNAESTSALDPDTIRQELEAMGFGPNTYGTVLVLAASQNNIHLAKGVLGLTPDVNTTDESGNSALIWAAYNGSAELVRLLVAVDGINLDYVDSDGKSALRWAEDRGHTECAQILREAGAQSIYTTPSESTSSELTQEEAAAKLQQMGISPSAYDEALCAATDDSDNEKIRLLIIAGANVNCDAEDDWTPLTNCCLYGNAEGLRLLLAAPGIDVNRPNAKGDNAIIWAAVKGEAECLRLLLAVPGINVNFIDGDGKTALEWAQENGHMECVQILSAAGGVTAEQARNNEAPVTTPSPTTTTTPTTAPAIDSSEAAAQLQQMGISPDSYNEALCAATDNNENDKIRLLVAAGADVNCAAEDGWTPITNVCIYGNAEGLRLLLAAPGIDVNRPNAKGDNAIIWAAVKGEEECLRLLLAVPGINVNFIDGDGRTAYEWAQRNDHQECAELLRAAGGVTANQARGSEAQVSAPTATAPTGDSDAAAQLQQKGITPDNYNRELCAATDNNDNEMIQLLIAAGADVNHMAEDGFTPLTNCCLYGNAEGVRMLLAAPGIDVNLPNRKGDSAIIWAAVRGEAECLRLLLAAPGINVNVIDSDGKTAFEWAMEHDLDDCIELLRAAGGLLAEEVRNGSNGAATPDTPEAEATAQLARMGISRSRFNQALCDATDRSDNERIRLLIIAGADVNAQGEDGWTPLTNVCLYENIEGLRMLLAAPGIDINKPNKEGNIPLVVAARNNNEQIKSMLQEAGASLPVDTTPAPENGDAAAQQRLYELGITPSRYNQALCEATDNSDNEKIQLLIAAGADVNTQAEDGWTPLTNVCLYGNIEGLRLLLAAPGIDMYKTNRGGETPYQVAIRKMNQQVIQVLREAGYDIPVDNTPAPENGDREAQEKLLEMGITPSHYGQALCNATDNSDNEKIRLLIAAGADVNHQGLDGWTPLTNCCVTRNVEGLRLLLAAPGIDVNKVNANGDTAFAVASERNVTECLRVLRQAGVTESVDNTPAPANGDPEAQQRLRDMGITPGRYNRALCDATDNDDNNKIRLLIAAGADVNCNGPDGWTPLTNCCLSNNPEGLRLLLAAPGIDVNKPNRSGNTPLQVAAEKGSMECVRLLREAGATIPEDNTPAPAHGDSEAQQQLREMGITPGRYNEALCRATDNRRNELIRLLVAAGADVNCRASDGWTPLTNVCLNNNPEGLRLLLAAPGIDVNKQNDSGNTPIQVALEKGSMECVRLLREAGAPLPVDNTPAPANGDREAQQQLLEMGITPSRYNQRLCDATDNDDNNQIRLLIAAGADVNYQGSDGWTPLTNCCLSNNPEGLRLLLAAPGIDVNKPNQGGDTPLQVASTRGHTECVRLLREAGVAIPEDKTPPPANGDREAQQQLREMGITPSRYNEALCEATDNRRNNLIRLLVAAGADVNSRGSDGWTPLTNCCLFGNAEGLRLLLAAPGIDINRPNRGGDTPLQVALEKGNFECVRLLRAAGATIPEDSTPAPANGNSEAQQQLREMGITPSHYNQALCDATDNHKNDLIRLLIAAGADVNIQGSDGWTPLTNCCLYDNAEGVRLLLAAPGIDINRPNRGGDTPLQVALEKGNTECVRLLREAGATIPEDSTPAPANGDSEAQQQLREMGITPSRYNQALCDATDNRKNDLIRLLIAAGADVNYQGSDGWTPLTNCCLYGNAEGLRLLLAAPGIDVNKPNSNGATPIQVATEKNSFECLHILRVASGLAPVEDNTPAPANGDREAQNQLRERGITPSHYNQAICNATDNNNNELLRLLIAAGADVNATGSDGWTPLTNCSLYENAEGIRLLLAAPGIDVNKPNSSGETPLEVASKKGNEECVRLLRAAVEASPVPEDSTPAPANGDNEAQQQLREMRITPSRYNQTLCDAADNDRNELIRLLIAAGADVNAFSDSDGYTPLTNVCVRGNTEGLRLLLAAPGIEVNKPNTTGDTAIIFVAIRGHVENLRMLMAVPGIDINFIDSDNKTALDWATENGHTECVNILREAGAKSVQELR